ncbi:GtrA family protein [Williamsia sp. DF01-3]|uniref:GtrA family protein n=1 Tax=Williamsia sp. DF01-3 TaxID=2934157 RepID=UPI001FF1B086|nr:GtrA family protein [Williamsia sp. DF01-3]MCK0518224.1 GtrA family protein [Williamsia sp. DF01-3]
MSLTDGLMARMPAPLRALVMRHHELIKFAIIGGSMMILDMAIFYSLSLTILETKPVIAKVISGVLATIVSYILNREWAFKNRGGRETHHEAFLFFAISGVGVVLQAAPLFVANNLFDIRSSVDVTKLVIIDFILGYIIGNLLQMAFRFWALRRFAFPESDLAAAVDASVLRPDDDREGVARPKDGRRQDGRTQDELADEELGHT